MKPCSPRQGSGVINVLSRRHAPAPAQRFHSVRCANDGVVDHDQDAITVSLQVNITQEDIAGLCLPLTALAAVLGVAGAHLAAGQCAAAWNFTGLSTRASAWPIYMGWAIGRS